ncbi:hypothetical protein [Planobispora takensis]|uniref:Uncharacterized protein n=1 Tax=Planobispora takensis TaxID=1367882 RepID=A0A8J3T5N0_9ACTN|nr:hypothetical protein [Planobispora takensis]GII04590.1 hypothetical protein Pta02_65980 [Planobispora takensis]
MRDEVNRLKKEHDPFRGQVLGFGFTEHRDNVLVSFLPRPELAAHEVILPEGRLETVEEHIVGIAEVAERLTAAGRLRECTVIVMTGPAMRKIDYAVSMARTLQPSMVVIEDVDLIAEDRSRYEASPLLFSLLGARRDGDETGSHDHRAPARLQPPCD